MRAKCTCCAPRRSTVRFWQRNVLPYGEGRKRLSDDEHMVIYYLAEQARSGRLTRHDQIALGHRLRPLLAERVSDRKDQR